MEPNSDTPVRTRWKHKLRPLVCVVAFFVVLEIIRITAGPNWHAVVPGEIYRSAHLPSDEILSVVHRFGIKTIVNLRDRCPWEPWYQDETKAVQAAGIGRCDVGFSAYVPPAPAELQKLWKALETAPRPLMIHCRRGADRTGLASTIAALYQGDTAITVDEAKAQQLTIFKGHAGVGRVEVMSEVVNLYQAWLTHHHYLHTRSHLKEWIMHEYRPGRCWAVIEPITIPEQIHVAEPQVLRVRVHNHSYYPWEFKSGANVGMHLRGYIEPVDAAPPQGADPSAPKPLRKLLAAGFMNITVLPQQSIELDVALPVLREPGKYLLFLDIMDESTNWFGNMLGSRPFKHTLEILRAPVAQR